MFLGHGAGLAQYGPDVGCVSCNSVGDIEGIFPANVGILVESTCVINTERWPIGHQRRGHFFVGGRNVPSAIISLH